MIWKHPDWSNTGLVQFFFRISDQISKSNRGTCLFGFL